MGKESKTMTLETFSNLIHRLQDKLKQDSLIYQLGIDVSDYNESLYKDVITPLIIEAFGNEGLDWIEWYVYEKTSEIGLAGNEDKEDNKLKAFDDNNQQNNQQICQDIPSLYLTITALNQLKKTT